MFEYLRNDKLDAPNYFDSHAQCRRQRDCQAESRPSEVAAEAEPVRRLDRRPDRQEQRVLLRQLRRLSPRRRQELHRGGAERRRVGACRAGGRGACGPGSWRRARSSCRARSTNPDFDIAQLQATQNVHEDAFSARLDFKLNDNWSTYVRVFQRSRHEPRAPGRHRPAFPDDGQADQRRRSTCRASSAPARSTSSSSATTRRESTEVGIAPAGLRGHRRQPERIGRQHRHRRPGRQSRAWRIPGRPGSRQQRRQRTRGALQPVLADVRRLGEPASRAATTSRSARDVRMIRMSTDQLGGITYTLLEPDRLPGEHAGHDPVLRRPERAEPVPQRRHRA